MSRYWIVRYLVWNEAEQMHRKFTRLEDYPSREAAMRMREEMIAQGYLPVEVWIEEVF